MNTSEKRLRRGIPAPEQTPADAVQQFVAGAPGKGTLPWQKPPSLGRIYVNTAQPEPLMLQVDWLSFHQRRTKRDIIEAALREYAAKELVKMGVDPTIPDPE